MIGRKEELLDKIDNSIYLSKGLKNALIYI
jgi:hypothetical protein